MSGARKGSQTAGDTTPPSGVPQEPKPDPNARHDGRFRVDWGMRNAGAEALGEHFKAMDYDLRKVTREQLQAMVESVLRAANQKALGYAEGSIARNKNTGATARRYYSAAERRLVWLLVEAPSDGPLAVDKATDLPGGPVTAGAWEVVYAAEWDVIK